MGGTDDFALAVGADFVQGLFNQAIGSILQTPIAPYSFEISLFWGAITDHINYTFSLSSVTLALQTGQIVLTIKGHAHSDSFGFPSFDFTVDQAFTLQANGTTVDLVVGSTSLDTSSTIVNIADWFSSAGVDRIRAAVVAAVNNSGIQDTVRQQLTVNKTLGPFLQSLLAAPADGPASESVQPTLAYTNAEIRSSGLVLHGSLAVPDWPAPDVEYERIPVNTSGPLGAVVTSGPDYSAFKSWIPGGTIDRFDWSVSGQSQPFDMDANRFVLIHQQQVLADDAVAASAASAPAASASVYTPLCLTLRGTRLSASGPVVPQSVLATACGYRAFPVVGGVEVGLENAQLLVALTQAAPSGVVQVVGHASPLAPGTSSAITNRLVHFADAKSAGQLPILTAALLDSKRQDAPTAIIAVMTAEQMASGRHTHRCIVYAEDQGRRVGARVQGQDEGAPADLDRRTEGQHRVASTKARSTSRF